MLGAHLAQCSRSLASSSSARAASLHTSAVLQAVSARTRRTQQTLKANIERRKELQQQALQNRPHVVLGHKPGDEAKWHNCDLAKVIITEEDIRNTPLPGADPSTGAIQPPKYFNYGIGEEEKEVLLDVLPTLTSQTEVKARQRVWERVKSRTGAPTADMIVRLAEEASNVEKAKAMAFAKLVDLRNANARGIAYENRRRIIAAFSEPENPNDTGRPEVQAALVTYRIRNLWEHLSRVKKDIANRRSLRRLVHERAKILRYLKRVDEDRYDRVLERLGLERSAVEGELVV
ncbi:S15/NS1 RNA-binding domain-containing protein [Trametes sanguinea]|nr:S15/NS1 RNA-binding domain-containing protein [Trametes sanguinea]